MWRNRIVGYGEVAPDQLLANESNWRIHPFTQQQALSGVLDEVGYVQSVIVNKRLGQAWPDGRRGVETMVDGHMRAEIAISKGQPTIPVVYVDLDPSEEAKVLATMDPISEMATVDKGKLDELLREVQTGSEALAGLMTDLAKSNGLLNGVAEQDEVPEPPKNPVTKAGDLWLLGEHRLLCGDSTDGGCVDRLFAGGRASLLFTSPPYGQQRDYDNAKQLVKDWDCLMQGVFQHCSRVMEPNGQVLINLGLIHRDGEWMPYWDGWIAWMREQGWRRFGWYVWDQGSGLPGNWNGRLAPSHEFVFHFNRNSRQPEKFVDKKPENVCVGHGTGLRAKNGKTHGLCSPEKGMQPTKIPDSVIRISRHMARGIEMKHAAVFPVGFAAFMLRSWPGLAYDPFLGSGTMIIAAEQLGRRCYGIEISPAYVDVCVERWEKLTGQKARRGSDRQARPEAITKNPARPARKLARD